MDISVAVCTWNRAKLLDATLHQMRHLRIPPGIQWEVLVVNNRCTDDTDAVLQKHAEHLPLRRLYEEKQGQSHARNCAIAAARGDLLIWTDDDVLVDEGWLQAYHEAAKAWPEAAFFGGRVDPWYETVPPAWVEQSTWVLRGVLALKQYDDATIRPFAGQEQPIGASMAFRLDLLKRFSFDTTFGRTGADFGGGEDLDLIDRMTGAGLSGVWVGSATARHWVPRNRMTFKYVWDWCFAAGVNNVRGGLICGLPASRIPRWVVRQWLQSILLWCCGCALCNNRMRVRGWCGWAGSSGLLSEWRRQRRISRQVAVPPRQEHPTGAV